MKLGRYTLRLVHLARTLASADGVGQEVESWPEPEAGVGRYSAMQEGQSVGETIAQGLAQTSGSMRVRILGNNLGIAATDQVRFENTRYTGLRFHVRGVELTDSETVLTLDKVAGAAKQ